MTNIQLTKPAASQTQTVTSTTDARFVLDFNTGDAQLAKSENGENLIITFEDGARIEVEGFYTAFNKDNLPTLSVNGQDITGDQLTAILGEDLMPAAGPAASAAASAGGSNASFADPSLDGGINRLGGLDIGFPDEANLETTLEGVGALPGQSADVAAAPEVATVAAAPVVPDTPPAFDFTAVKDTHEVGVMNRVSLTLLENDGTDVNKGREVSHYEERDNSFAVGMIKEEGGANRTVSLELDADAVEKFVLDGWDRGLRADGLNWAAKANNFAAEYTATYEAKGEFGGTASADVHIKIGDNATDLEGATDGSDVAWVATNTGTGTINTGGGSDLIVVANNATGGKIEAGDGADTLYLGDNSGTANAGAGNDMINVSGTNTGTISAGTSDIVTDYRDSNGKWNGVGGDTITVNVNAGTINGSDNADFAVKIDVLEGAKGSSIMGGEGHDYVTLRGGSGSTISTGGGRDLINLRGDDYREAYGTMDAPADGGHWWVDATSRDSHDNLVVDKAKLAEIAAKDAHEVTVYGGEGHDTLQCSDASNHNTLYGDAGNDKLEVFDLAHNNTLYGDDGSKRETGDADNLIARRWAYDNDLYGEGGNDVLIAQEFAHHNTLHGGHGNDLLVAQGMSYSAVEGKDWETFANIRGNAHDNKLYGEEGADRLFALSGAQNNLLDGGIGDDYLYAGGSRGYFGSEDSATSGIRGKNSYMNTYSTTGNTLIGGEGNDLFVAEDLIVLGNNYFHGGEGNDVLVAQGLTRSTFEKLVQQGKITGMEVIVTKVSSSVHDQLIHDRGEASGEWITDANTLLHTIGVGTGSDSLDGWTQQGSYSISGSPVTYQQYTKDDTTILVTKTSSDADGNPLTVSGWDTPGSTTLTGDEGTDNLLAYNGAYGYKLDGGDGNDYLKVTGKGTAGNTLVGGEGNDEMQVDSGASYNLLSGGEGDDVLKLFGPGSGSSNNTLDGGADNDLLVVQGRTLTELNNSFDGGEGIDVLLLKDAGGITSDTILSGIQTGDIDIQNVEAIITKGSVGSAQELITKAGLQANADGGVDVTAAGWTKGATTTFTDPSDNAVTFAEYSHGDLSILVAQSIVSSSGGA